jgi:two-component system, NtrC family, response regulator AtoC
MLTDFTLKSQIDAAELPSEDVIFGGTTAMQEVRRRIYSSLDEKVPILVLGESGTGKEVIAKYLHLCSARAPLPFIRISCLAFSPGRPSFDASGSEGAGTLFLDEIGDLECKLQRELVQTLSVKYVNARIICSTRIGTELEDFENLQDTTETSSNKLVRLSLPPLRERRQDIPQLCEFLMKKQAKRFGKHGHLLASGTLELLTQWQWPGNLRELENWVARVVILESQDALVEELKRQVALDRAVKSAAHADELSEGSRSRSAASAAAISRVMQTHGWSRRRAAQKLKISYRALLCGLRDAELAKRRRNHRESPPMQ